MVYNTQFSTFICTSDCCSLFPKCDIVLAPGQELDPNLKAVHHFGKLELAAFFMPSSDQAFRLLKCKCATSNVQPSLVKEGGFQRRKGIPAGVRAGILALEGCSNRVPAGVAALIPPHICCSPPTFLTLLCQFFILIMDHPNWPVLASWVDKVNALLGETLTPPTIGDVAIFKPTTIVGRVPVRGSITHDHTPRFVSDYITDVTDKNLHIPIFQLPLHPKDVEDLHLRITSRLSTNSNSTVKLHVGEDQSADVLFARRRSTRKKVGKDNYLLPKPLNHTLCFLSLKDAPREIPIYLLPTSSQLQWRPHGRYGLTNPTMMSTTNEEPLLPFPMG